jgi:hypothetical protein
MFAFFTYFQSVAANHLPNVSQKGKKSGEHVAAGTSEAVCKFCIFPTKPAASRPQARTCPKFHLRQRQHVCPGGKSKLRKKSIFVYDKYKIVYYEQNFSRGQARETKRRGRRRGGRRTRHDPRGHVVTCTFPKRLRSGRCH